MGLPKRRLAKERMISVLRHHEYYVLINFHVTHNFIPRLLIAKAMEVVGPLSRLYFAMRIIQLAPSGGWSRKLAEQ